MEAHKCICMLIIKFALNTLFIHICRNRIVDIKKSNRVL